MSKRIFTENQIKGLLNSAHISRCSERSITYTKDFKLLAIKLYGQGLTPAEIFRNAGLALDLVGKKQPKACLKRWLRVFRAKDEEGLSDRRGKTKGGRKGRPRTKGITEADKIKRLEAEIAYLKLENDFLAKLRAKRAESNSGRRKNIPL